MPDPTLDQLAMMRQQPELERQSLLPNPDNFLSGQQFAMADEPPPPSDPTFKRLPKPAPMIGRAGPAPKYGGLANQRGPAFQERHEDVQRLMELMSKGKNQREIAQELGIGERTVRRFQSEELGTQQKATEIQKDPELIKKYQQMVKEGWSLTQMARALGKNEGSVSRHLKILNKSGDIKWTPEGRGGVRTPSMPQFKFKDRPGEVDEDYIKALEQYLNDIKAYYNAGPTRSIA
jgi:DNA-binding CsgD family transcriptional regulator